MRPTIRHVRTLLSLPGACIETGCVYKTNPRLMGGDIMMIQLTQKEVDLIDDALKYENICVKKYATYAAQAQDPELKALFGQIQKKEEQHVNTLNQLKSGQVPNLQQQ